MGPRDTTSPSTGTEYFPTRDVVDILGISRRQLQYWAKTDLVSPSATTPGGHRRYSFADLVVLKTTKRLIDSGVSVQRIRDGIRSLRDHLPRLEVALSEVALVATGDVVLVFPANTAYDAVAGKQWVFEVATFEREVRAWRQALDDPSHRKARPVRRPLGATEEAESKQTG